MCNFSDAVYDRGIREGMVKGLQQGRLEGLMEGEQKGRQEGNVQATIEILNTLSERLNLSFDQAMDLLALDESDRSQIERKLKETVSMN